VDCPKPDAQTNKKEKAKSHVRCMIHLSIGEIVPHKL
jgi:hypothetical protein